MNGTTVMTNISYPFTAEVLPAGWNIAVDFPQGRMSVGSDGENVYSVQKFDNSPDEHRLVSSETYPWKQDYYITLPWVAYCSASYFNEKTNIPAPWLNASIFPEASVFSASIKWLESNPRLPESMTFRVAGKRTANDLKKLGWLAPRHFTADELKKLDWYPEGFVGAEYSINGVTNVAGLTLPLEFILKVYHRPPDTMFEVFAGKITTVSQANHARIIAAVNPSPSMRNPTAMQSVYGILVLVFAVALVVTWAWIQHTNQKKRRIGDE
jgi:hypothetical protein